MGVLTIVEWFVFIHLMLGGMNVRVQFYKWIEVVIALAYYYYILLLYKKHAKLRGHWNWNEMYTKKNKNIYKREDKKCTY